MAASFYSMRDELEFVRNLGTYSVPPRLSSAYARGVVEGYIRSLPERARWFPGASTALLEEEARKRLRRV